MTNDSSGNARFVARGLILLWIGALAGCDRVSSSGPSPDESNPAEVTTRQSALTVGTWDTLSATTPTTAGLTLPGRTSRRPC